MKASSSSSIRTLAPLLGSIALLLNASHGAEIAKLQNVTALNLAGAWSGGVVPGAGDVMLWNSLYSVPGTAASLAQIGGSLSVLGLKVTNVGGSLNAATTMVGFQDTTSANTLTIGSAGIDLSAATQALMIQSRVTIGASQNWVINNSNANGSPAGFGNGEDLMFQAFSGTTTTATTPFNLGGNTVTTSGTGQLTISSGYAITSGTINVGNNLFIISGGTSRLVTVGSDVNLNVASGSTLHFQSNSAAVTSAGNITLNGGTLKLVSNNATNLVTLNGALNVSSASTLLVGNNVGGGSVAITTAGAGLLFNGNLTGSAGLTVTNNASTANALIFAGNNSGYSGTLTFGGTAGRIVRLNSATAGSAAATWNVGTGIVLQTNNNTVSLGTLTGAGTINNFAGAGVINVSAGNFSGTLVDGTGTLGLTKSGAGTLTLSGAANTFTGPTTVTGGTLLVGPGALSGTLVTVSSGATYAAQSATSGTINAGVSVAGGGTVLARPLAAGTTITIPALASAATGTITFDTGVLGNPTAAPLAVTTFTPTSGTKLKFIGSNLTPGTFTALNYSGAIGGGGFAGLALSLPFRVAGSLVNNPGVSVGVTITGTSKPVWTGNVNANWNIDTVGDGSTGTANWTATSGPNTYVEAGVGVDSVVFDDTATGSTNVNLTTTLSPLGVAVANTALNYTFSGTGRIAGAGALAKSGTGTLTIANTGNNDFSGGLFVNDGTVKVGDGATAGAGTIGSGTVTLNAPGVLELNRPDAVTFANTFTGNGGLTKSQANTVTLSTAPTLSGALNVANGTLRFTNGGSLSGPVSGSGGLAVTGGTLALSGTDPNTFNGLTTVSAGTLQLNKTGVDAIGGTIAITGTGAITFSQPNQIADTATVTFDKAINNGNLTFNQTETIGALTIINGNDTAAQVLSNTPAFGFQVAGLVTVGNTGVYSVASNSSAGVGGISLSGTGTIRISANSNPTTLNVGSLGITASGGTIQVGQGVGAFDAVMNLAGNVTTTGNFAITDGGFTGGNLRQIHLGADVRTFNIATGTTTTIAPDIAGEGGITKTGNGTLQLTAASASTYTGPTTITAGTFLTTPAQTAGSISVAGGATLGVTLANAATTLLSTDLTTSTGSTLQLATGALGNPTAPVLFGGNFAVDGATTIRLTGTALTTGTGIPLISYTTLGGAAGFGGLSVLLPTRMTGTLVNDVGGSQVVLNLSVEQAKWSGGVNGNWDIDSDGTGATGTANWVTTVALTPTRYFQGPPVTTDTANFDDSATGTTNITLTAALSPIAANVNNSTAKTYTFGGSGRLTGATSLVKNGNGTLILANSLAYNHTGGTVINDGVLQVGDGVTPGIGFLPTTAVTNNATISLNRPDDFGISTVINGVGTIIKKNTNTATFTAPTTSSSAFQVDGGTLAFSAATSLNGTVTVNTGTLQFNAGSTINGPSSIDGNGQINLGAGGTVTGDVAIVSGALRFGGAGTLSGTTSGSGSLIAAGGTVAVNGFAPNTHTGTTTVSAGVLQFNKPAGIDAVGGNVVITGTGQISLVADEQIPDTATLTFTGSSTDSLPAPAAPALVGHETVGNLVVNSSVGGAAGGQVIMRNGFTVLGTATLTSGILGVGSGNTATVNGINITSAPGSNAILRVSGNTAASILNVGAGGITASGGEIQVKFNTANNDATLNLGGNFTATGDVAITNAGYTGIFLNVINLVDADRTFDIAAGTTTTVAPNIAGSFGLTKTGNGTLTLNGNENIPSLTTVAGTTNLNKTLGTGTSTLTSNGTTNIAASQTLASLTIGDGGVVVLGGPAPAPAPEFAENVDASLGGGAVQAVPEPGAASLLIAGALGLLGLRRRQR